MSGRPNSAIEFYWGFRLRRLIDELEMSGMRENRREIGEELLREAQSRIERQLARTDRPVYLVISSGKYGLLQRHSSVRARVLFELEGYEREPGDELIVITQTAAQVSTRPALQ